MIKKALKRLIYGHKADSSTYIKYLKSKGVLVGEGTTIYRPRDTVIDVTRPSLLKIGKHVKITSGVKILTHGYDWAVLRMLYKEIVGSSGKVVIGDNVFIGMNTIILKGVTIGNNVIIGAGAIVNKDIPDNVVVAGNPAKIVMSLEDYYNKRKNEYINEAKEYATSIVERFNRKPEVQDFKEFFPLFLPRKKESLNVGSFYNQLNEYGNLDESYVNHFLKSEPIFYSFEEFLEFCEIAYND